MTVTEKQLIANQSNALLSTGPVTIEGKVVISKNAIKHGITASRFVILQGENPQEYEFILEQLKEDFQIRTGMELVLVEKIAQAVFKKQRLVRYEQALIENQKKKKELEEEADFYELEKEVETLNKLLKEIDNWIESYEKATTPRRKKQRLAWDIEELKDCQKDKLKDMAKTFIPDIAEFDAFEDLKSGKHSYGYVPKTEDGAYLRKINSNFVYMEICLERGDFPITSFESLKKIVEPRLREKEEELKKARDKQEIEKNLMLVEASLIPNEANQEKIKRYEAFLDSNVYKALNELQKLQAFFKLKEG